MIYFDLGQVRNTLLSAIKSTLTSPRSYFSAMPETGSYSGSMVLLTLIILISTLLGAPFNGFLILFFLPFVWLFMLLSMWAWAAYLAWAVRTFTDRQLDTVNAFQLATYASMPMLFGFLPVLGIFASIWNLYLNWLALTARVQVKEGVAIMIILIPLLVLALSFVVLIVLLFAVMPDLMQTEMDRSMQF